ncbi:hypothetical protein NPIL_76971 [Nephila pilipes]|uniref:Uncharacterized protein n=1 Tax=Nephila pilipes TaxID=299642 RepID=A0A8X6II71_NEPPI|nr:hypothetical protein NPIL_76971 [Nephila pilipes]
MCHATEKWTEVLPAFHHGLQEFLNKNMGCTSAELVYRQTFKLLREFFDNTQTDRDPAQFGDQLRHHMHQLKPNPTFSHAKQAVFVPKDILSESRLSSYPMTGHSWC